MEICVCGHKGNEHAGDGSACLQCKCAGYQRRPGFFHAPKANLTSSDEGYSFEALETRTEKERQRIRAKQAMIAQNEPVPSSFGADFIVSKSLNSDSPYVLISMYSQSGYQWYCENFGVPATRYDLRVSLNELARFIERAESAGFAVRHGD